MNYLLNCFVTRGPITCLCTGALSTLATPLVGVSIGQAKPLSTLNDFATGQETIVNKTVVIAFSRMQSRKLLNYANLRSINLAMLRLLDQRRNSKPRPAIISMMHQAGQYTGDCPTSSTLQYNNHPASNHIDEMLITQIYSYPAFLYSVNFEMGATVHSARISL